MEKTYAYKFIILVLFFAYLPVKSQYTESKEHQKVWFKFDRGRKKRDAYNPYLNKKHKPNEILAKENAKVIKKQNKAAKKQKRRSMKKLGIKPTKVKRA